jgi:hypothetical protein
MIIYVALDLGWIAFCNEDIPWFEPQRRDEKYGSHQYDAPQDNTYGSLCSTHGSAPPSASRFYFGMQE